MPAKKKVEEKTKTSVYVFWVLIAIIGAGLLFSGIGEGIHGGSLPTSVMLIVVGIAFIFIGLIMVLGKANIEAKDVVMPGQKEE